MINTTDGLIALVQGPELHRTIQHAIATAISMIERQMNRRATADVHDFTFYKLFGSHNQLSGVRFDEQFLEACFETSQSDSQNSGSKDARQRLSAYLVDVGVAANGLSPLKRGIKLMLVELWRVKALLLPSTFTVGAHFSTDFFEHPLLNWLKSYDPSAKSDESGAADARRVYYYGPRLLWTTDWQEPKDVSLTDLAALHRASILYRAGLSTTVIAGGTQLPFVILADEALKRFPLDVKYSADDVARFSRWALAGTGRTTAFEDYDGATKPQPKPKPKPKKSKPGPKMDRAAPALEEPSAAADGHAVLQNNFVSLQKIHRKLADWSKRDELTYAGREHVDLSGITAKWVEAMRAYMYNRKYRKEYRSDGEPMAVLNMLADYLFFYLPWWLELAESPKVGIPTTPKELTRYAFVTRNSDESLDDLPETLLTVIAWRRKTKEGLAIAVKQLKLFFDFLETDYADDESIAGPSFRSPINPNFDAPRIKKKNKTNKLIIPRNVYSYLQFYCYALEEAGMQLERLALSGSSPFGGRAPEIWLNLAKWGIQDIQVTHRLKSIPVLEIPNVFEWHTRTLKSSQGQPQIRALVPHCTSLRMLTTSLETGLRVQSVQWLDRRSWRSLASKVSPECYTLPLFVNTDKTKVEPWEMYVVNRVWALLQRQERFQDQFEDADAHGPVFYEGIPDTPFAPIEPLFRSAVSADPLSDNTYDAKWQRLMVGFEKFYHDATGDRQAKFYTLAPTKTSDTEPVIRELSNGTLYCSMSILATHTPHSCRATYATNRAGILSLPDRAEQLGHTSVVTTAHYTKPSVEDIQERLRESDLAEHQDFLQFEAGSDVHVRADKPNSALVRSFTRDRSATIQSFRFMPGIQLWSTEDSLGPDEGLQLLRQGPMSRIRFRETHVCPVGEECPADIIELIGEPRRCGCCPLAMRCIDHAPAIAAKSNQLLERIRFLHARFKALEAQGEPVAVLDQVWDELELDANEYTGWQLSEELLASLPPTPPDAEGPELLVEKPEVVKRHLMRVSRSTNAAGLMLQRIADSNAYPSMTTPQVQIAAAQLKRRLLAGATPGPMDWGDDSSSAVVDAANLLAVMMKATGQSLEQARSFVEQRCSPAGLLLSGGKHGI